MKSRKKRKYIPIFLFALLSIGLVAGITLGRYAGEWKHGFGLIISPVEDDSDYLLRRYFRSNELLPVSESAAYTVNGTSTWFSVANALDSLTVSKDEIKYTLTWYGSTDGTNWKEYDTKKGTFDANEYKVERYSLSPVTIDGAVCNHIKVHGSTSSFLQEDIEAVYTFVYSDYSVNTLYSSGVITLVLDTNDTAGDFTFNWAAGVTADNSDPTKIFQNATVGPSGLTVTLSKNTVHQFLFFVTDSTLSAQLNEDPSGASDIVTVKKE